MPCASDGKAYGWDLLVGPKPSDMLHRKHTENHGPHSSTAQHVMGYIDTSAAHLAIRKLFTRRKRITMPQVLAELMKTDPQSPKNLPDSWESPKDWTFRQTLACEVVLTRLIEAGRVYPADWLSCLRFHLECEDEDSALDPKALKSIRRALGGWRKKAPPWLDAGRARIARNLGWTTCIDDLLEGIMESMWAYPEQEDAPCFIAGKTVQLHRLIQGEDL